MDAKGILGGPDEWRGRQDRYAEALADLGLQRGKEGSKARHATPQERYKKLQGDRRAARSSMFMAAMAEGKAGALAVMTEIQAAEAKKTEERALERLRTADRLAKQAEKAASAAAKRAGRAVRYRTAREMEDILDELI